MERSVERELMQSVFVAVQHLKDAQEILTRQVNGGCDICKPGQYCIECQSCDNANNNIQDAIDKIESCFDLGSLPLVEE